MIPFVGREEERLVLQYGTTERAAVLIERADGLRRGREEISRVPSFVLPAVERRAMEVVGARAADHVDLPSGDTAVLGRQDALDDLHFGDRVEAHDGDLILAAVLRERPRFRIRVRFGAVDREAGAAGGDAVHLHHAVAV